MSKQTITRQERDAIMARENALRAFLGRRSSYLPEEVAHLNPPTNAERSAVEVFDFINDPPTRYFLYVSEEKGVATTWTGDSLGKVSFGREWRSNMGDKRQSITFWAINGRVYHGTYFKSTGDYARVKASKGGQAI